MVFCWGGGLGLKVINHPRYPRKVNRCFFFFLGGGSNVVPLRAFGFDGKWG